MKLKKLPLISEIAAAVPELELVQAPGTGPTSFPKLSAR